MKYEFLNRVILFLTLFISIVFAQNQVMLQFSLSIFTIILSFYKPITNPFTNISLELFLWYFFIIIGFYGIFIGEKIDSSNYDHIFSCVKVFIIYPTISLLFVNSLKKFFSNRDFINLVFISSYFILIISLISFLSFVFDFFLLYDFFKLIFNIEFSFFSGRYQTTYFSIINLFYFFPIILFFFFRNIINFDKNNIKNLILFIFLISFIFISLFISGRRITWILFILIIFPFFYFFLVSKIKNIFSKLFFIILPIFLFLLLYYLNYFNLLFLTFTDDPRFDQFELFLDHFLSNPLGSGFAVNFFDNRLENNTFIFELFFIKLLGDIGFLFLLLLISLLIIFYRSIYFFSNFNLLNCQFFIIILLIFSSNFTNPYLFNFDGILFLFMIVSFLSRRFPLIN